jgi:DNA-binding NarL/FixJ family response regulator
LGDVRKRQGGRIANPQKTITVLIADDHEVTRKGICAFLAQAPDLQIVGEARDGDELKRLVAELRPQILLLDLIMPDHSPVEFEKWVRENYPETITLVLTAHDRDAYLSNMMEAGVAGYLDKKLRAGQLIASIRRAARGEILFDEKQLDRARRWREEVNGKWESLSNREREVLQRLTEGMDNNVIAASLEITINTVEKHLRNIYLKLGITSRSEAILWWLDNGTDFRN